MGKSKAELEKIKKYARGGIQQLSLKGVQSLNLRKKLKKMHEKNKQTIESVARTEVLLPAEAGYLEAEGPMEKTWRFTQESLIPHLDTINQKKVFDVQLDNFGPYTLDYTRNGRHLLLGGRKGHISLMDWSKFRLKSEFHVKETIRDVKFLHNETMYAVAQKKYLYIYDNTGIELHCMRNHVEVNKMDFLPYHFLLATINKAGMLQYLDTSTGNHASEHRTRLGPCDVIRQNPYNAVINLGHSNGCVTLWTPSMAGSVAKILAHKGAVMALDVDIGGNHLVTSGLDGQVKVWDIRTYQELHSYFTVRPASTMSISQRGLLALGYGPHLQVWKDALTTKQPAPYMAQEFSGKIIERVKFCPYDDVLAVTHNQGFTSMVVPGSGEANFDTFEANPFQTKKGRREKTVHDLLEKLKPEMITIDPNTVGNLNLSSDKLYEGDRGALRNLRKEAEELDGMDQAKETREKTGEIAEGDIRKRPREAKEKNKMRGKSRASKKWRRRKTKIIDEKLQTRNENIDKAKKRRVQAKAEKIRAKKNLPTPTLGRFA